jgi:hypothetical protein
MTMEPTLIADPVVDNLPAVPAATGSAAPAVSPNLDIRQNSALLRGQLAAAIEARAVADARAAEADAIAARAADAEAEATALVERLRADIEAAGRDAIERHAQRLTEAFRAARELPEAPTPPQGDMAALRAAESRLSALHAAARELADEAAAARNEAADAARSCRSLVDQIIVYDARALADQWVAATKLCWALSDQLKGLARLGGDLLPTGYQEDLLNQVDRRRVAVAENPQLIERYKFDAYLNGLVADAESRWTAYGYRLMSDANAVFGEALSQ